MLPHIDNEPYIVIHKWMLAYTNNNKAAAALICVLDYCHDAKIKNQSQARSYNQTQIKFGDAPTQYDGLLQWHTEEELEKYTLMFDRKTLREGIKILESLGCVEVSRNPNPKYNFDKTKHFLYKPEVIQKWLSDVYRKVSPIAQPATADLTDQEILPDRSGNFTLPSGKNGPPSGKNPSPLPYNTTYKSSNNSSLRNPLPPISLVDDKQASGGSSLQEEGAKVEQVLDSSQTKETKPLKAKVLDPARELQNELFGIYRKVYGVGPSGQDILWLNKMAQRAYEPAIVEQVMLSIATGVGQSGGLTAPTLKNVHDAYPSYAAKIKLNLQPKRTDNVAVNRENLRKALLMIEEQDQRLIENGMTKDENGRPITPLLASMQEMILAHEQGKLSEIK